MEGLALEPGDETVWREHRGALHEEIARLPRAERTAIVLCDLEGQSPVAAARQLHWRVATLETRLANGRARLQAGMTQRGLTIPASRVVAEFARDARKVASGRLIDATVASATRRRLRAPDEHVRDIRADRVGLTTES